MTDCAICFEEVSAATGQTILSCTHTFHFTCLVRWFANQEGAESCPCCRKEMLPTERASWDEGSEGGAEDSDEEEDEEDDEDFEEEQVLMTRAQVQEFLTSNGGMVGVTDVLWSAWLEPGAFYENGEEKVTFDREELNYCYCLQTGNNMTDEQWATLFERHGLRDDEEVDDEDVIVGPAPSAPPLPAEPVNLRVFAWVRVGEGRWERRVHNPEEVEDDEPLAWDGNVSAEAPPASLAIQTSTAAKKIQAVWRGFKTREVVAVAKSLVSLTASSEVSA
jgi:Ring finger domain/IQ calmodulin-binding motif